LGAIVGRGGPRKSRGSGGEWTSAVLIPIYFFAVGYSQYEDRVPKKRIHGAPFSNLEGKKAFILSLERLILARMKS